MNARRIARTRTILKRIEPLFEKLEAIRVAEPDDTDERGILDEATANLERAIAELRDIVR